MTAETLNTASAERGELDAAFTDFVRKIVEANYDPSKAQMSVDGGTILSCTDRECPDAAEAGSLCQTCKGAFDLIVFTENVYNAVSVAIGAANGGVILGDLGCSLIEVAPESTMSVVSFRTKCEKASARSEAKSAASSSKASIVEAPNEQNKERNSDAKALRSNMNGKRKYENAEQADRNNNEGK
jgi:hypothetical protein